MTNLVKVVAAIVDTEQATFYREDASTFVIKQGDTRLAKIIAQITPILARNGVATIDLDIFPTDTAHVFTEYQERSSGLVQFFRVAKDKLKSFFVNKENEPKEVQPVEPVTLGTVVNTSGDELQLVSLVPVTETEQAALRAEAEVAEVMAHAKPVSDGINRSALSEDFGEATETIVAVVGGKLITDVHKLESQFKRSNTEGQTQGMQRFMERVAAVSSERRHSLQDLMRFMERGDLPVAEDGCIVIYKILRKQTQQAGFTYVDCHSKKVPQRVGARIYMDNAMVDSNRRNECSNGLHVARRAYLGNFSGDVVTICKVAPEDVIAVPEYDSNKMRVSAYHILFELPKEDFTELKRDKPLSTQAGKTMLSRALSGDHPPHNVEVKITEQNGGGIVIKNLSGTNALPQSNVKVAMVEPTILVPDQNHSVPTPVDIRAVSSDVAELQTTGKTRAEQMADLIELWKASSDKKETAGTILAFKKAKKVGWDKLGVDVLTAKHIEGNAIN